MKMFKVLKKYPLETVLLVLIIGLLVAAGYQINDRSAQQAAENAQHVSRQDTWCKNSGDAAFLNDLNGRPRELMREVFIREQRCLPMSTD